MHLLIKYGSEGRLNLSPLLFDYSINIWTDFIPHSFIQTLITNIIAALIDLDTAEAVHVISAAACSQQPGACSSLLAF